MQTVLLSISTSCFTSLSVFVFLTITSVLQLTSSDQPEHQDSVMLYYLW